MRNNILFKDKVFSYEKNKKYFLLFENYEDCYEFSKILEDIDKLSKISCIKPLENKITLEADVILSVNKNIYDFFSKTHHFFSFSDVNQKEIFSLNFTVNFNNIETNNWILIKNGKNIQNLHFLRLMKEKLKRAFNRKKIAIVFADRKFWFPKNTTLLQLWLAEGFQQIMINSYSVNPNIKLDFLSFKEAFQILIDKESYISDIVMVIGIPDLFQAKLLNKYFKGGLIITPLGGKVFNLEEINF